MDKITFFFAGQGRAGKRKMSQDGVGKGRARVKMCSVWSGKDKTSHKWEFHQMRQKMTKN